MFRRHGALCGAIRLGLATTACTVALLLSGCAPPGRANNPVSTPPSSSAEATSPAARATLAVTQALAGIEACCRPTSLRVRSGPGLSFAVVGGLTAGECLEVNGRDPSNSWVRTAANDWPGGAEGWLAAEYLSFNGDLYGLPVAQPNPNRQPTFATASATRTPTRKPVVYRPTDTRWPTATEPPYMYTGSGSGSACQGATAICRDGTCSYSQHRQGTCSWHGGVRVWLR